MQTNDFNKYWNKEFKNLLPFCHHFRDDYAHRWFRIHSLPKSKRYADTQEEYQIIFNRQNHLCDTLIGEGNEIMLVFGICTYDVTNDNYAKIIDYKEFQKVKTINLSKREPENYEDNIFLDIYVKYTTWQRSKFDKILKGIADDEIRMLFVFPSKNRIIAPYDGGVDIIMENETKRDEFRSKYKKWLPFKEEYLVNVVEAVPPKRKYFKKEWLIELLKEQKPKRTDLILQLEKINKTQWIKQPYIRFVSAKNTNQKEAEWQIDENIILEHKTQGTIVLDILKDGSICGFELLDELD